MQLTKNRPWILALAIALGVVIWMLSGQSQPVKQTQTEEAAVKRPRVLVQEQLAEPVTRFVTLNGRTAPARIVELNAETVGRVVVIGAARGERVSKGDVIVQLDDRDRQARLEEAKATVKQRELEYEARQSLKGEGYISDTQLAEGLALLEAARAELKRAELDLENMTIRAPFDGALQDRTVEIGDYVGEGDPVATIVENDILVVTGNVAEADIAFIRKGMQGKAALITGQTAEGSVRYVAPVAEQNTRTFTVELEIPNREGTLPAGVTAKIQLPVGQVNAHKLSPSLLTLDEEGNLGIKTVNGSEEVVFHIAEIVSSSSDGIWIAGLPQDARIIVQGQGFVQPGEIVDAVTAEGGRMTVAAEETE